MSAVIQASHWSKCNNWPSWCVHFSPEELACRGTGQLCVEEDMLRKLERLRQTIGKPLIINSGYRSPEHNRAVGGAKNSQHLVGKAVDISLENVDGYAVEQAAIGVGFTGIGRYPDRNFIHVDIGPEREWGPEWPVRTQGRFAPEEEVRRDPVETSTIEGGKVAIGAAPAIIASLSGLPTWVGLVAVVACLVAFLFWLFWMRKRND